jgi:glycosyltransferase involved in cell wall biosynthesis
MVKSKKKKVSIEDIFVSVVVVAKPEAKNMASYITDLSKMLRSHYANYEVVIVDNDAKDEEISAVAGLLNELPCLRIIKLSQQFKYDTALFAGLEVAIGDYVCTVDAMVDPIKDIAKLVESNQTADVVQGVSSTQIKGRTGSQVGRKIFYWYNRKYVGIDVPLQATYFASYSRRAINSLTNIGRNHRHIRHLARKVGYGYVTADYEPIRNPGTQHSLRTGVIEALEIATSYSTHPLRFVTWLGVFASIINVLYACYVVIINILGKTIAPGWTSTSMQLSLMFFLLFMIMVILSEYVGRILGESHREPSYYIADELTSTVSLADAKRRNITK